MGDNLRLEIFKFFFILQIREKKKEEKNKSNPSDILDTPDMYLIHIFIDTNIQIDKILKVFHIMEIKKIYLITFW